MFFLSMHVHWKLIRICTPRIGLGDSILVKRRVPKTCAKLFLPELRQISTNFDNFGHTDRTKLCEVDLLSTSPNSRQSPTVLNADVPNRYK